MTPEVRLRGLGIELPQSSRPAGNYSAAVRAGDLLYLSGKAPISAGSAKPRGRLGAEFTVDQGYAFARIACIDLLAAARDVLGSLDRVVRVVEVHGSLATTADFEAHAEVLDGASDLLVSVFGEAGLHARSVIGVASLRDAVPLTVKATLLCCPER